MKKQITWLFASKARNIAAVYDIIILTVIFGLMLGYDKFYMYLVIIASELMHLWLRRRFLDEPLK